MDKAFKKRLDLLENGLKPETCFCLVTLPDGTQTEKTVEDWYQNSASWHFVRFTRGGSISAVWLLLATIGQECAESAREAGYHESAERMTAEAENCLAQYKRTAR